MDAASLLALVRFHAWANDRILTTMNDLSQEEFRGEAPLDHHTAFDTVRHLVDVDWSWREFCAGNDVGQTYAWDHGFVLDDLPSIHAFCIEEDARLRSYVTSLDQTALDEPLITSEEADDVDPPVADPRPRREPRDAAPQRAGSLPHRTRTLTG